MDIGDRQDTGTVTIMVIIMAIIVVIEAATVLAIMRDSGRPREEGQRPIPAGLWLRTMYIKTVRRVYGVQEIPIMIPGRETGWPPPTGLEGLQPSRPTVPMMFTPTATGMFIERMGMTGIG